MEREIVHVARVAGRIGPRAVRARTGSLRAARSPADACAAPSSAAAWAFAGPAACPRAASPRLASRLTFRAVQLSSSWTWNRPVPRHRARPMPCSFLSSATPPSVTHASDLRPYTGGGLATRPRGQRLALGVGLGPLPGGREHRALRRHVGDYPQTGDVLPHLLAGEPLIGADRLKLGAGEAGALDNRHQRVALMALRSLTQARHHAARLGIDSDLAAVDEMRAPAGPAAQPCV